jgi:hypothetical protein
MTPTEIDNLPAGAKLDVLVAQAIGDIALAHKVKHGQFDNGEKSFRPSADWNDAMWAAEKINDLDDGIGLCLSACGGVDGWTGWTAQFIGENGRAFDKSGPLAIARAIAKIGATK